MAVGHVLACLVKALNHGALPSLALSCHCRSSKSGSQLMESNCFALSCFSEESSTASAIGARLLQWFCAAALTPAIVCVCSSFTWRAMSKSSWCGLKPRMVCQARERFVSEENEDGRGVLARQEHSVRQMVRSFARIPATQYAPSARCGAKPAGWFQCAVDTPHLLEDESRR